MTSSIAQFLDWFGICVFALSGALVASRKRMDIEGFALLGCVTGITKGDATLTKGDATLLLLCTDVWSKMGNI
jgi:uncharacterized membrane protein YeiH